MLVAIAAVTLQWSAGAQGVDVATVGPKVGQRIPAFTLGDQHGRAQDLRSLSGPGGLMLVFFRSADW